MPFSHRKHTVEYSFLVAQNKHEEIFPVKAINQELIDEYDAIREFLFKILIEKLLPYL